MKSLLIAVAAVCAAAAVPAFAQSNASNTQQVAAAAVPGTSPSVAQSRQWVPPYGEPVHEKTRAQVYRELVQAEQDGQLAYLNSTLYAH
ncbi:DUF4148 domain-containing protein [Burkholderia thailandensis]|uniref:DUF4148 domain-containing protein n=1 Tax=Burkholderia thailandensis TaxID=57975 RepID=UPI00016A699F|nr:DUF4148 domain-containing protein [Burkholderia thailandensis]AHI64310.1 hypothetical protein BTL_99 [Burkholderia thailandensis H0587]AIP62824.1 hypothetical protein DR62_1468 [Burkholderia thailandensis]AOI53194.1 hypothetical protein WI24_16175 [Burkholderia thailandensis]AOJ52216.1 hypothetical protein AQ475_16220 [Burkholderia thailandensis]AVR24570.1 DUF4148 domain-containing protein [Burkholderia thailandensis]